MNRKYTTEQFRKVVKLLRDNFKDVALTTDVIVGFPGETETEFETTYKFLEDIKFSKMHIFKYSPRQGTVATKMPNQIEANVKEQRSKRLIELSNRDEKEFIEVNIGKTLEVLFETKTNDEYTEGHTTNYIVVKAKGTNLENTKQFVKIEKTEQNILIGKIM